jgi:hypothetical protein
MHYKTGVCVEDGRDIHPERERTPPTESAQVCERGNREASTCPCGPALEPPERLLLQ